MAQDEYLVWEGPVCSVILAKGRALHPMAFSLNPFREMTSD